MPFDLAAKTLKRRYEEGRWQPDAAGDLTFAVELGPEGHLHTILPGAPGYTIGVAALDNHTQLSVCVATAVYEARQAMGLTDAEIATLNNLPEAAFDDATEAAGVLCSGYEAPR